MPYIENYNTEMAIGYAGMVADTEPAVIVSRTIQTATGVGFGKIVAQGEGDHDIIADLKGGKVFGITVRSQTQEANNVDIYPVKADVTVMRKGVIWAIAKGNVKAGDPVFYNPADGALSNATGTQLAGCRWETTANDGNLARLRVNFDVPAPAASGGGA